MIRVKILIAFAVIATSQFIYTPKAEAGPLLDFLLGRNRCCQNRVFRPLLRRPAVPQYAAPNCGTCTTTCQQTCQRVVVNYVPYTAYRTDWERVPVTTYRQTSSTDPCTGCTVTCNRPCTTYSWRMKQTPFTTYRPVYRTETYRTPVTYSTPAPACNTCAVPSAAPATNQYYQTSPNANGVILEPTPAAGGTAADQRPALPVGETQSRMQWPTQINTQPASGGYTPGQTPQIQVPFNQTASAPSVEKWNYSPVKLASYQEPVDVPVALRSQQDEYVGSFTSSPSVEPGSWQSPATRQDGQAVNDGWND